MSTTTKTAKPRRTGAVVSAAAQMTLQARHCSPESFALDLPPRQEETDGHTSEGGRTNRHLHPQGTTTNNNNNSNNATTTATTTTTTAAAAAAAPPPPLPLRRRRQSVAQLASWAARLFSISRTIRSSRQMVVHALNPSAWGLGRRCWHGVGGAGVAVMGVVVVVVVVSSQRLVVQREEGAYPRIHQPLDVDALACSLARSMNERMNE
jgi:hypothetical protein